MPARKRTKSNTTSNIDDNGHPPKPSKRPRESTGNSTQDVRPTNISPRRNQGSPRQPMGESTNTDGRPRDTLSLQKEVDTLKKQLKVASARAERYKSQYKNVTQQSQTGKTSPTVRNDVSEKIPKPSGNVHIRHHMGLDNDGARYLDIRETVIQVLQQAGADLMVPWAAQPTELKAEVIQVSRQREPYLNRFKGDWATQALIAQFLRNHIAHNRRKRNPTSSYNMKRSDQIRRQPDRPEHRVATPREEDDGEHVTSGSPSPTSSSDQENEESSNGDVMEGGGWFGICIVERM